MSSGSTEALANGGMNNNGAAAGNAGVQNVVPLSTEPILVRLVQFGGSLFIQPIGNQLGQALVPQLIPIGALQENGAFLVGQTGAASVNPQAQVVQGARGGLATLFALLPQRNVGGDPQGALLTPGQVQLITPDGLKVQQQPGPAAIVGQAGGRLRFQRSLAARLRRAQSPLMKVMAAEEEEECSGMETEDKQATE